MQRNRIHGVISVTAALLLRSLAGRAESLREVRGQVVDAGSGKPIEGAWIVSGGEATRTNREGWFALQSNGAWVGVRAAGYSREQVAETSEIHVALTRFQVRGLYLSFWGLGSEPLRTGVLETVSKAHLNAVVIDIKGDRGFVSHPSHSALGIEAGGNRIITIRDPDALLSDLHRRGLYVIARIVVFKDDPVARSRPDLAIKTVQGKLFVDREGLAWTDPFHRTVWDYNIELAIEAAKEGFDEIQFDYVRFPDQKGLRFSKPNTETNRRKAIVDFLTEARKRLLPFNVFLSADNFGYACWNLDDTGIGQCFADVGPVVDYISPMLYPSSFQFGIPGLKNPLNDPYRIVFASLERAKQRTGFSATTFRPWLQAFDDYAFDRRKFGKLQLEQQIKAAQDAGADGWLLWDPRNRYSTEALSELAPKLWWHKNRLSSELSR
ncbi:MAG TPA: putative glycoside hydrolase [Bryobacteraceae bacterium]|jgi:hypothetical protein